MTDQSMERAIDLGVMERLATDRAYLNAENAEEQAEREREIEEEVTREVEQARARTETTELKLDDDDAERVWEVRRAEWVESGGDDEMTTHEPVNEEECRATYHPFDACNHDEEEPRTELTRRDQQRFGQAFAAMPYGGVAFGAVRPVENVDDVLDHLSALRVTLERIASESIDRERELDRYRTVRDSIRFLMGGEER